MNPIPYGTDPDLDALYEALGLIEEREIHAIEFGRLDLLPSIRAEQLPLKARINRVEGTEIYEEARISHYFFEHGGITLIFANGHRHHETTPENLTAYEHKLLYHGL